MKKNDQKLTADNWFSFILLAINPEKIKLFLFGMLKKNKIILDTSSKHHDNTIDIKTDHKKRIVIITFYNNSNYGVDIVD